MLETSATIKNNNKGARKAITKSLNMDQALLEPVLKKHKLVAFLINMDWVLIRRKAYIDVFIKGQPYNSVQVLFEIATKVSKDLF